MALALSDAPTGRLRTVIQATVTAAMLLLAACDEPPPTAPGPPLVVIAGTWTGTVTDRTAGSVPLLLTASGYYDLATGSFALTFPDPAANATGIFSARTNSVPTIDFSLFINQAGAGCAGTPGAAYLMRVALSGNRMTGTYEPAPGCPLLGGGSVELTRR